MASIVFSFWIRSLDLTGRLLRENGVVFGQVDGTVTPLQREEILKKFQHDPSMRVLLMTLGTGAAGYRLLLSYFLIHWLTFKNIDLIICLLQVAFIYLNRNGTHQWKIKQSGASYASVKTKRFASFDI